MTAADPRDGLRKDGRPGIDRLWDSQWVNVVNSPEILEALRNYEYEDAVNIAVRMTEQKMAENFAHARPEAVDEGVVREVAVAINYAWTGVEGSPRRWWAGLGSNERKHRDAVARAAIAAYREALTPDPTP